MIMVDEQQRFRISFGFWGATSENWQTKNKSRSGGIKIQVQGLQNRGLEGSGSVLGRLGRQNRLGAVLEPFWSRPRSVLDTSWARLGASWERPGGVLEAFGGIVLHLAVLQASWGVLGLL